MVPAINLLTPPKEKQILSMLTFLRAIQADFTSFDIAKEQLCASTEDTNFFSIAKYLWHSILPEL